MTEQSEVKARCASYFEWLYQADPPAVVVDVRGVTIPIADAPINPELPSFVETQDTVNHLKGRRTPGICGIHAELLKDGGNAVLVSMHAVLRSVWNTGIIPTDWKRGLMSLSGKGRVIARTATTTEG